MPEQRDRAANASERDAEQRRITELYTKAADQLGHEKAAVRLAGLYAMARLADDWDDQRQVCINVLCAYLRMPYEPDPASEKHREGEREVRYTITRIIRDHLRDPSAPITWCGRDLDFTNATFDGGDFDGAQFTGGKVSFGGAQFTGGTVSFDLAKFTGGTVSFGGASFTGGTVSFKYAEFTGGKLSFETSRSSPAETFTCDDAKFTLSCSITWGPFEPPAAWTALQERKRRQNEPPP